MAKAKGNRFVQAQEPETDDKLSDAVGFVSGITRIDHTLVLYGSSSNKRFYADLITSTMV